MINKTILLGRVGSQPEIRNTENTKIASFSLATNEKWKAKDGSKQERTTWHNIVIFGNLTGVVESYVNKGDLIYLEGKAQVDEYQDKEGNKRYAHKVNANVMQMLGSNEKSEKPQEPKQGNNPNPIADTFDDSDSNNLPF